MAQLNTKDIEKSLVKKGFSRQEGDHHWFELWHDGKFILRTKTSHSGKQIGDDLIHKMGRQCRLTKKDFKDLVECPLSHADYITKLQASGDISVPVTSGLGSS